jgi:hypothetical protein
MSRIRASLIAIAAAISLSAPLDAATLIAGTGDDSSFLVFEAPAAETYRIEIRYDHDPLQPIDGYDALQIAFGSPVALGGNRSRLGSGDTFIEVVDFGSAGSPNVFVDLVSLGGLTLQNTPFPDVGPFWAQWVSGGTLGEYPTGSPTTPEAGSWTYGAGASSPWREIAPGSWDGYVFNDGVDAPATQPIPEPGTIGLLVIAALGLALRQKRRVSNP